MEEDFKNDFVDTLVLENFTFPAPSIADLLDWSADQKKVTQLSEDQFKHLIREGGRIKKRKSL